MPKLGVNIDHVATLRQARGGVEPDPVKAALVCQRAGCHSIVAHLREDRRHIQDEDIERMKEMLDIPFNLEMSMAEEIVEIAKRVKPRQATLVPEKRQELTTEGGLDVVVSYNRVKAVIDILHGCGIRVSLFIDPVSRQVEMSKKAGADAVELHTGSYANADSYTVEEDELAKLKDAARAAANMGLILNAGHGLDYKNVKPVAAIPHMNELNIGHSIISYAVFAGLENAVREMAELIT